MAEKKIKDLCHRSREFVFFSGVPRNKKKMKRARDIDCEDLRSEFKIAAQQGNAREVVQLAAQMLHDGGSECIHDLVATFFQNRRQSNGIRDPDWWEKTGCFVRQWQGAGDMHNDCERHLIRKLGVANTAIPSQFSECNEKEIVVLGDIHGDFRLLKLLLLGSGVAECDHETGNWNVTATGAETAVILLGDLVDDARPLMVGDKKTSFTNAVSNAEWKIFALINELRSKGLEVVTMAGNHETMVTGVMGEYFLRYSLNRYRSITLAEEELSRRQVTKADYDHLERPTGWTWRPGQFDEKGELTNQSGYMNKLVSRTGGMPVLVVRGKYVFCHAGLHPEAVNLLHASRQIVQDYSKTHPSAKICELVSGHLSATKPSTNDVHGNVANSMHERRWIQYTKDMVDFANVVANDLLFGNARINMPEPKGSNLRELFIKFLFDDNVGILMTRCYSQRAQTLNPTELFERAAASLLGPTRGSGAVHMVGHCVTHDISETEISRALTRNVWTTTLPSPPAVKLGGSVGDVATIREKSFPSSRCQYVNKSKIDTTDMNERSSCPFQPGIFFLRGDQESNTVLAESECAVIHLDCGMSASFRENKQFLLKMGLISPTMALAVLLASIPQMVIIPRNRLHHDSRSGLKVREVVPVFFS